MKHTPKSPLIRGDFLEEIPLSRGVAAEQTGCAPPLERATTKRTAAHTPKSPLIRGDFLEENPL